MFKSARHGNWFCVVCAAGILIAWPVLAYEHGPCTSEDSPQPAYVWDLPIEFYAQYLTNPHFDHYGFPDTYTFRIQVSWNPVTEPEYWPWPAQAIADFANTIFPVEQPPDIKDAPAAFIAQYWGYDADPDYDTINLDGKTQFLLWIWHNDDPEEGHSGALCNYLNIWHRIMLLHRTGYSVERMVYDPFVHEFQHIAYCSLNNQPPHFFGAHPYESDSDPPETPGTCQQYEATTEFFSKAAEWLYRDYRAGYAEIERVDDFPPEMGLGRDDYWERCLIMTPPYQYADAKQGGFRYMAYGLFAAYIQDHFEAGTPNQYDRQALHEWRWLEYSPGLYRPDMWSLAEFLYRTDWNDYFDATDRDGRLREAYQEYALAVWCDSTNVLGEASVWVNGKDPRDEFGVFTDWDEWCGNDIRTLPMYNLVEAMDTERTIGPILTWDDFCPDCCGDTSWKRLIHIDSYTFVPLPFVADENLDTGNSCGQLSVTLEFLPSYTCFFGNACADGIGEWGEQQLPTGTFDDATLHIWILGYPTATEDLHKYGGEAELISTYEDTGITDYQDVGENGVVEIIAPCFGGVYRSVVLLMTLTEDAASEHIAYAARLPFKYTYKAEVASTPHVNTDTNWIGCACLNNDINITNSANLTIAPGTTISHKTGRRITVYTGSDLTIGAPGGAAVDFSPVVPNSFWDGIILQEGTSVNADNVDFGKLVSMKAGNGIIGLPSDISLDDCEVEMYVGGLSAPGLYLEAAVSTSLTRCTIDASQRIRLGRNAALQDVTINCAIGPSAYLGFALEVNDGSTSLKNVRIANACKGIQMGCSNQNVVVGDGITDNGIAGVEILAAGCPIQTVGLSIAGGGTVDVWESSISASGLGGSGFTKGCEVEDHPDFTMRQSRIEDVVIGVRVKTDFNGTVDLGLTEQNGGDNCITSSGLRVDNLSAVWVEALGNYWGVDPESGWFSGHVHWEPALESCPLDPGGGGFYLGQQTPSDSGPRGDIAITEIYPNPANPRCHIGFRLPNREGGARVEVFDASGRHVRFLFEGACDGKEHRLVWDGKSDRNREVRSGIYLVKVAAGAQDATEKLIFLR